jgi:CelD/BcsL family acetyltransferase involved in cellulose biosynthesis
MVPANEKENRIMDLRTKQDVSRLGGQLPADAVATGAATDLTVTSVATTPDFDALLPEWKVLHDEHGISVFQSFEYLRTWWRYFGESNHNAQLHIIVIRDHGRLVAIAPFYIERVRTLRFLAFRRLAFLGREISDYLDVIVAKGCESMSVELIASHLVQNKMLGDVILLEDITDRSAFHALLYEALIRHGFRGKRFINEQCPRTRLLNNWEDTLASFSTKHRKDIKYQRRNICKNLRVEFEVTSTEEDVSRDMGEFIAMHQERWTNSGHKGVFADSRVSALHRDVAQLFFRRGWLFLTFLRLNGKRLAANYGFKFHGEVCTYLNGMRETGDSARYSPGRVLHGFCIEHAISLGAKVYDFMRGAEPYKLEFEGEGVPNLTLLLYRPKTILPEHKFKLNLVGRSLVRRAGQEWRLLVCVVKRKGLLSGFTVRYILERLWINAKGGIRKIIAPEKRPTGVGDEIPAHPPHCPDSIDRHERDENPAWKRRLSKGSVFHHRKKERIPQDV